MGKLLRNGTLVTADSVCKGDLAMKDGKIVAVGTELNMANLGDDWEEFDLQGKLILPGIIDAHTHYQLVSRNTVTADDFYTGSMAAACGGVTTFIDYADHLPDRPLTESLQKRIDLAEGKVVIDYTLHQTITDFSEEIGKELAQVKEMGISSVKIFTTYRREGYMIPKERWGQVFQHLADLKMLLTVHAEDDQIIQQLEEEYRDKGMLSPRMHPRIRPARAEAKAVCEVGKLAKEVGIPIYIAHLSSAAGLAALQEVKAGGADIHAETAPHYLLLDQRCLGEPEAQKYIMTPPLRTGEDFRALWRGLQSDDLQVVATDHCAFNLEQKLQDDNCLTILPGIPGTETLLPLTHHFGVHMGVFDYSRLVQLLSTNPAKIFGLYPEKGSLEPGTDADLVIFDPEKKVRLQANHLHSEAGYTPYEGFEVQGYPVMTFLRGELIYDHGTFCGKKGTGKFIKGETSSLF